MFDQVLVDLPRVAQCPCVASATEYAGMHNAGWYCVYPTQIRTLQSEPEIINFLNLEATVRNDEGRLNDMKFDPSIVESMLRDLSNRFTQGRHRQHMLSLVWRSTGVDEFRVTTILDALTLWVHVLGMFGNSHWSE